jgi:hypothetical protein
LATNGLLNAVQSALSTSSTQAKTQALIKEVQDWEGVQRRYRQMYFFASLTNDIVSAVGNDAAKALFATVGAKGANQYATPTNNGNSFVNAKDAGLPANPKGALVIVKPAETTTYLYWTPRAEAAFTLEKDPRMYVSGSVAKFKRGDFVGYATGVAETDGVNTWIQLNRGVGSKGGVWWALSNRVDVFPTFALLKQAYPTNSKTRIHKLVGAFAGTTHTQSVISVTPALVVDVQGNVKDTAPANTVLGKLYGEGTDIETGVTWIAYETTHANGEAILLASPKNHVKIQFQ